MIRTLLSYCAAACLVGIASVGAAAPQQKPSAPAAKPATTRSSAKPPVSGTVNINTASASDLQALPGIGAKTAARIVEYRQKNGPFKKIEELMNVRGVGEKNFLKLKANIAVAPQKPERAATPQQ